MVKIFIVIIFIAPVLVIFLPQIQVYIQNIYEIYVNNFSGIGNVGQVFYSLIFNSGITPLVAILGIFFGLKFVLSFMGVTK